MEAIAFHFHLYGDISVRPEPVEGLTLHWWFDKLTTNGSSPRNNEIQYSAIHSGLIYQWRRSLKKMVAKKMVWQTLCTGICGCSLKLGLFLSIMVAISPMISLQASKLFDKTAKKQLVVMLGDLRDQLLSSASALPNGTKTSGDNEQPMVTEAVAARVLLVTSTLIKEAPQGIQAAQQWADSFAEHQRSVFTVRRNAGGFWLDPGGTDLDLSANGIAAAVLARVTQQTDGSRRNTQLKVLENYVRLLLEGCKEDPGGMKRGASNGWIIGEGTNKGAFGGGYLKDRLSVKPSTAATAANAAFFAQMYALTHNSKYRDISAESVRWLLNNQRPIGDITNLIDGDPIEEAPIQTVSWCGEAFLSAFYLLQDSSLNQQIIKDIEPLVRWLIRTQNDRGLWGDGTDQRGSTGAVTLLAWYFLNTATKDEAYSQSVEKAWQVFLNPVHSQSFGVNVFRLTTSLLGLTTAEMIKPGITYKSNL